MFVFGAGLACSAGELLVLTMGVDPRGREVAEGGSEVTDRSVLAALQA